MGRTGRRPGSPPTRDAILAAARTEFGAKGFRGATIRSIAAAAEVDPALVHHYFGTKDDLFAATLELPFNPAAAVEGLLATGLDDVGARLVHTAVGLWDEVPDASPLIAALRSMAAGGTATATVRTFVEERLVTSMAAALPGPDPELRAELIGSQLFGLLLVRYVLRLEPVASASRDALAAWYGPTFQRYATGDLAADPSHRPTGAHVSDEDSSVPSSGQRAARPG